MSEQNSSEPVEQPVEEVEEPTEEHVEDDAETFPRSYVERLRTEAAEHRTSRVAAEERADASMTRLRTLTIRDAAGEILQDPSDLAWSDDYEGEDGMPDPAKVLLAAEELIRSKPHLARPRGDVGMGFRGHTEPSVDLAALMRG